MEKLTSGDTIGVIAPAFPARPERLEKGISYLQEKGFRVKISAHLASGHGYFSATDKQRAADIMEMFRDPDVKLIICARGGWGGLRVLEYLDFEEIKRHPKPLVGYSDVTTLQLALWEKCRLPSLSGPMVAVEMGAGIESFTEKHFWDYLASNAEYALSWQELKPQIWRAGKAEGTLLGGCLSLVASQLGSPYCPDFRDAILFLEDIGEDVYKMDRYLAQLQNAGLFDVVAAVVWCDFIDCENNYDPGFEMSDILKHYTARTSCPVLAGFPYGHGAVKVTMPIGIRCKLDSDRGLFSFAPYSFNDISQS